MIAEIKHTIGRIRMIFAVVLSVFLVYGCAVNPVTGKKELMLMSEQQEIALGKQADPSIVAQYGLYDDKGLQAFINEKGQQMAKISHRPRLSYEFKILDSPVINAFALPGGYVYFTRGILAHFNNEAEFAGVLGHEIGHVTARHSARQQTKAQLAQVLFVGGMVASKEFRSFAKSAQQGLGLLFLKYGRDNESESDRLGVEYSTKIKYDANQMAGFFRTLQKIREQSKAGQIPTFMSTHPDPADRFQNVRAKTVEWQRKLGNGPYDVNRDSYLKMIDGLIYGEDPQQGFLEGSVFYHPGLKFKFTVPTAWQFQNSPTQVQMAPKDGKALMIFTLSGEKGAKAAAAKIVEQYKLNVKSSKATKVNGLPSFYMISEQVSQNQQTGQQSVLNILTYCIEYEGRVYVFHGLANESGFQNYVRSFATTMESFNRLTDPAKINAKPDRIRVKTVPREMNLKSALRYFGMPEDRHGELSIVNGMELSSSLKKGTLIKVIEK